MNFDARSDTEWGTLRSFIRLQATWNAISQTIGKSNKVPGDGNVTVDQAFIELGGLRMGYTESAWSQTQGGGASNWGSHSWHGMYYGYSQRQLIAYTFQGGNGFFGTVSIEDDGTKDYVPDVVAKIGVNQGWGAVWAKFGYDEEAKTGTKGVLDSSWSASAGLQYNVGSSGSSVRLIGFYHDGPNQWAGGPGIVGSVFGYAIGGYQYSVLASYRHAFSSTLSASIAAQYFANAYGVGPANSVNPFKGVDAWGAEASIVWMPVTNFEVRAEIHYDDVMKSGALNPKGTTSGYLRFTRYF